MGQSSDFTYADLVKRYGPNMAYDLLLTIEKVARIRDQIDATVPEETRLQRAMAKIDGGEVPQSKSMALPY